VPSLFKNNAVARTTFGDWHHRSLNSESETAPIQSSADNARRCSSSNAAHDLRGAFRSMRLRDPFCTRTKMRETTPIIRPTSPSSPRPPAGR
jgi:hypothetical protein